jgi:hypothetical protein
VRVRVNVESVPRLPTFPARWVLNDPRGRAYFTFWTSEEDGQLQYCLKMAPCEMYLRETASALQRL